MYTYALDGDYRTSTRYLAILSIYLSTFQFLVVEGMHTSGVMLLAMVILPRVDMVRGIFILALCCSVPAFLKVFFGKPVVGKPRVGKKAAQDDDLESQAGGRRMSRRKSLQVYIQATMCGNIGVGLWYLFNVMALLVQLGGIVAVNLGGFDWLDYDQNDIQLKNGTTPWVFSRLVPVRLSAFAEYWQVPLCLLFISVKWWENFVDHDRTICSITIPLVRAKADWHRHRNVATIITSLFSMVIICFLPYALFPKFHFAIPGRRLSDSLAILARYQSAIIHVGASAVAYCISVVVTKVCMQKFCFNLAILLATPISVLLVYLRCILQPIYLDGQAWMCPEKLSTVLSNSITQWHFIVMLTFWVASLIIGSDLWWSNQNRLDKTDKYVDIMICFYFTIIAIRFETT